jgi:hypothetical protein
MSDAIEKQGPFDKPPVTGAAAPQRPTIVEQSAFILQQMQSLVAPDQIVELRALGVKNGKYRPHTEAGFFDAAHLQQMAFCAAKITPNAKGVYFTLNPLQPDLLARRCNRIDWAQEGELATDKDVLRRQWLLVDIDPVRDSHISASDTEKAQAWQTAQSVRDYLRGQGWPRPIVGDSGNGYHLLYRIDLPTIDDGLVERILKVLAARFDNDHAKIDQKVFNPARICKVPGTLARKGDSTLQRPHRRAVLLEGPDS